MEYTKLGNTEITVSKLCVGCAADGGAAGASGADAIEIRLTRI